MLFELYGLTALGLLAIGFVHSLVAPDASADRIDLSGAKTAPVAHRMGSVSGQTAHGSGGTGP